MADTTNPTPMSEHPVFAQFSPEAKAALDRLYPVFTPAQTSEGFPQFQIDLDASEYLTECLDVDDARGWVRQHVAQTSQYLLDTYDWNRLAQELNDLNGGLTLTGHELALAYADGTVKVTARQLLVSSATILI